jgi:hypothetical protein
MSEAISKKDLVGQLQKDLPKVTDPKNKNARPVAWTGPGKYDYGYTGYQGHGMTTDKQERDRIRADKKKCVAEGDLDKFKKYTRPVVKTTPKIERTTNPAGRTTDHVEWIVTSDTGEKRRFTSKKSAQEYYDMCTKQGMAEGGLEANTPDPVVVMQDLKGKILDKVNLSMAAQKYKLGNPQDIKKQLAHQNYTTIGNYVVVAPMSGQPQDATTQGVAEGQTDYQKRRQRERDVDAGKPVSRQPRNPQTDYAKKRAKEKRDLEQFGETTNYWTRLQNERNTKIASLVNELKESVEKK